MKKKGILFLLVSLITLSACDQKSLKPTITGSAFEVLLVADEPIVASVAGQALVAILNQDMYGLPQSEPLFKISRTSHSGFTNLLRPARNIVMLDISDNYSRTRISTQNDVWAAPQAVVKITSNSIEEANEAIVKYKESIINFLVTAERERSIAYQKRYSDKDAIKKVEEKSGIKMVLPKGMNRFKEEENFLWIANSGEEVRQNIVIYSYPYTSKETFTRENLLAKRDSVMLLWIPGPTEDSYMATEYRVEPPVLNEISINDQYAAELRGMWRVQGDLMGGPFVNITRLDEKNQRVVTVEAFIYAPTRNKRNAIRQLEALLHTVEFIE
ncbi:MAG: DUF4837 family protein [Paludibacteraceae bacterium]|nr:DUF4837 family protein [Paludibacteraceae bacterium]MBP6284433.1 DUF4837 family protein [Paludibacteraceae bacterium]